MTQQHLYTGIIITLFIIIIAIVFANSHKHNNYTHEYLRGLWIADDKFCEDSGISGMIIYIGEKTDGAHGAYIVMHSDGAIMMEKRISIRMSDMPKINPLVATSINRSIDLTDLDVTDPEGDESFSVLNIDDVSEIHLKKIMPLSMTMEIDLVSNCMTWKSDETIYAKLYKDNHSSAFDA